MVVSAGDGTEPASVATATSASTTTTSSTPITVPSTVTTGAASSTAAPGRATTSAPAPVTTATARCVQPAPGSDFDGFGATEVLVESAQGTRRHCVLTADTTQQHQQGLMHQDDLDGYAGMLFRFPTAEERSFWMRNTSIPLSIAFFDAGGVFVSATDMEPCGDRADCPSYPSRGAAKFALEVVKGGLPAVGATPGSRLNS